MHKSLSNRLMEGVSPRSKESKILMIAVTLNIDNFEMNVSALKLQFYEKEGIEVQYQSLVYAGKPLRDGTLIHFGSC